MAQSLVVESPSSSKISAQSVNKWSCNSHGSHVYYVIVASIGYYNYANGRKLAIQVVFTIYGLATCPKNITQFSLILQCAYIN